jgi:hypothetical protein
LGSYSWTILVTNALIAYQKIEKNNIQKTYKLDDFLRFFFKYYHQWDWKNPISLSNAGKSFKITEKKDRLPIITSVEPCFNSAKNITKSTEKRIKSELKRAYAITQKPIEEWETLLENFEEISPKNAFKVVFEIKGDNMQHTSWLKDQFKGNFVGLIISLEKGNLCEVEFLPKFEFSTSGLTKAEFHLYIIHQSLEKISEIKEILEGFGVEYKIIG